MHLKSGVDQVIIDIFERNKSLLVVRAKVASRRWVLLQTLISTGKEEQFGLSMLTKWDWERVQKIAVAFAILCIAFKCCKGKLSYMAMTKLHVK